MPRSRFAISTGSSLAAAAAFRVPATAAQFTYKLGHPLPVETPLHVRCVQMAKAIRDETQGRLEIQLFPNSTLGSTTSMLSQVRLGSIELTILGNATYTGMVPVYSIDNVAFAFSTWQQPIEALAGPLGAYMRQELAAKGLHAFDDVWALGFQQITTSTKPIRTADDFSGLKLRTPPAAIIVELFKALGASPVAITTDELYTALQTHLVDGQEEPFSVIEAFRLYEVQKYLSLTNHRWVGSTLVSNPDAWKALPAQIQAIFSHNSAKYARLANNDTRLGEVSLADKLRRQGMAFNTADAASMRARGSERTTHAGRKSSVRLLGTSWRRRWGKSVRPALVPPPRSLPLRPLRPCP